MIIKQEFGVNGFISLFIQRTIEIRRGSSNSTRGSGLSPVAL